MQLQISADARRLRPAWLNTRFVSSRNAAILAGLLIASITCALSAATIEQETLARLEQLRAIKAEGDRKTTERYNKQMDEAWKFFNANRKTVLPILRRELSAELRKEKPSQMVLLDIGYFVRLQPDTSDKELGREALFALDTTAEIVMWNQQQLFQFSHAVVPDRDPRTLALLDKAFLRGKVTAFVPEHYLMLDETLVCVFLYGIYGPDAEGHLKSLLKDQNLARKIIEVLIWIGSPDSVDEVKAAMMTSRDYETFVRGTAFLMRAGGPQGQAIMAAIDPQDFDAKSQEYYRKFQKDIVAISYDILRTRLTAAPSTTKIDDRELKERLSAMFNEYRIDEKTVPQAIVNSGLPREFLINELVRIRQRLFYRVSDEALGEVTTTNAILNALRYRGK